MESMDFFSWLKFPPTSRGVSMHGKISIISNLGPRDVYKTFGAGSEDVSKDL